MIYTLVPTNIAGRQRFSMAACEHVRTNSGGNAFKDRRIFARQRLWRDKDKR
jgi:hypothetical protein